nr:hypothetical protein [Tanacetum cinerariifolium]
YEFVSLDPKLESRKSAMDKSFTLGSNEEDDHVTILQWRLFESSGCLLLVCRDDIDSKEFTIYEIVKGCPVCAVREEDSFLVINISGKVVKYNIISKTINQIFDIEKKGTSKELEAIKYIQKQRKENKNKNPGTLTARETKGMKKLLDRGQSLSFHSVKRKTPHRGGRATGFHSGVVYKVDHYPYEFIPSFASV